MKSIDQHWVDRHWYRQQLRFLAHDPLARLDPQVQLLFAVNPIHPLVVPTMAYHVAQIPEAQAKTLVAFVVR